MIELLAGIALRARQSFAQNGTWPADAPAIENQVKRIVARWPSAPPVDIALLLQGNCTDAQIDSFLQRVTDAQQKEHDAYGLTTDQLQAMLQLIVANISASKPADQLEGQIAQLAIAGLLGVEVERFASGPNHGNVHSTYDSLTAHAIIEVTTGNGTDKTGQLANTMVNDAYNPHRSPPEPIVPIVIYTPNLRKATIPNAFNVAQQMNLQLGTHIEVYIITSQGEWYLDKEGSWKKMQSTNSSSDAKNLLYQVLHDLGDAP